MTPGDREEVNEDVDRHGTNAVRHPTRSASGGCRGIGSLRVSVNLFLDADRRDPDYEEANSQRHPDGRTWLHIAKPRAYVQDCVRDESKRCDPSEELSDSARHTLRAV